MSRLLPVESAPNLIQINGTAVITMAQASGKDLYLEPHHRIDHRGVIAAAS
jgi:hypothetical protein